MAGSVLHTLIEVSEHFQDVMRLAAADGILDSWGLEVVLQDVALNLREDDNFHGNLLFGLHSLLLLLARKLAELGHEVLGEVCGCGWDTSHLPESQHTDIHRYTSGTVVRWVRGECYVLLASTSSTSTTTTSTDQQEEQQHQQVFPNDCALEEEEYQDATPGEVVSPEEGAPVSGGDEDPHCCSEEAECCLGSPSPQGEDPNSHEALPQHSKGVVGVWPGCQVHSCFTKEDEVDGEQKQHGACKVHCGQEEMMEEQLAKDESQEKMEDEDMEEVEEEEEEEVDEDDEDEDEEKEEQEEMDLCSEEEEGEEDDNNDDEEEKGKKEQEPLEVSCEEEEENEEREQSSEHSSVSNQNLTIGMEIDMSEEKPNEDGEQSNVDETDDTISRDNPINSEEGREDGPVSEYSDRKDNNDEGEENNSEACIDSKNEWRGSKSVENDGSESPLRTCDVLDLPAVCEDVEAAVVSEESLDGDNSCTLIIHEEEDTSCREEDSREEDKKENTEEDMSKSTKDDWRIKETLQETIAKDAIHMKENEIVKQETCRGMVIKDEIIKGDSSRKDDAERNWRENNIPGSQREDTSLVEYKENWRKDAPEESYKNTQEDSWKKDTTVDSYKSTQECSWREDTTRDNFKNTEGNRWSEGRAADTCNTLLQSSQEVTSGNSNSSNSQPVLPPHSLSIAPKEKCIASDRFGLQNPSSQQSFPHNPPPTHSHYEEEDEDEDDDDEEEESDDDSSSVTSSTSTSSSSSSSSSDDDDRINFKQRVERAAQAAREAEASAAARLASAVTQEDHLASTRDHHQHITPQMPLPHHLEDHTQLSLHEEVSSSESSSDEMTSGEDPGGGVVGGGGHGSGNVSGGGGGGSSSDGGVAVAVSGNGDVAPAVVVTAAPATATLVYVEASDTTSMSLVPPCPEPPDASLHSSRDPADLQAAQGLTDLQGVQNPGLPPPQSGAPLTCSVVDQMHQMPAEVRRRGGSKGLECVVCGKVFNRLLKLKQHHRTHTGERPWGCTSCSKTFSRPDYVHKHRLSCHTPPHQRQYSCYVCHRGFGMKNSLQAHLASHATNKPFTCDICGQTFALKVTRDTHKAQHTGSRPWVCSVCGRSYVTKYKLRAHMKAHTGELVCSFCGRQFTSQDSLGRHQRLHDSPAGKTSPILPTCSICNKKFATPSLLKRHIASHARQNAVKCGVCSQQFSNHQQLTAHQTREHHPHQQQQHQNQPLHQCPVCSKVYVQEVYLTRHMATHTTFSQQTSVGRPLPPTGTQLKETVGGGQPSPNISSLQQSGTSMFQQSQTEPSLDTRLSRQDSYLAAAQHQLDAHPQQHLLPETSSDRTQTQPVFLNYNTEILEDDGFRSSQTQE